MLLLRIGLQCILYPDWDKLQNRINPDYQYLQWQTDCYSRYSLKATNHCSYSPKMCNLTSVNPKFNRVNVCQMRAKALYYINVLVKMLLFFRWWDRITFLTFCTVLSHHWFVFHWCTLAGGCCVFVENIWNITASDSSFVFITYKRLLAITLPVIRCENAPQMNNSNCWKASPKSWSNGTNPLSSSGFQVVFFFLEFFWQAILT